MTSAHTADPYHLVVGERIGLEVYHRLVTEVVRSLPSRHRRFLMLGREQVGQRLSWRACARMLVWLRLIRTGRR